MAKKRKKTQVSPLSRRWLLGWFAKFFGMILLFAVAVALLWSVLNPPTTLYMMQESKRLGGVDHQWVPMDKIAPVMARSAIAAEDAN
jgi:monofunctional biosynthetic peptidoglycan transglycosylase